MKINEHEKISIELYGHPFTEVHLWLDEFCLITVNHRPYRHNKRGIEYIRKNMGELAAIAAEKHILDDGEYFINDSGEKEIYK